MTDLQKVAIERRNKLEHRLREIDDFLRFAHQLNRMNFDIEQDRGEQDRGSSADAAKTRASASILASEAPAPSLLDKTITVTQSRTTEPHKPERRLAFRNAFDVIGEGRKKSTP